MLGGPDSPEELDGSDLDYFSKLYRSFGGILEKDVNGDIFEHRDGFAHHYFSGREVTGRSTFC
jgi:hypothetical protein